MKDQKTNRAVKVGRSPDALLKIGCLVILWEMLVSPEKINYFSEKKTVCFLKISPEVNVVIGSVSELALVPTSASAPEKHLQPVFLQVVVEVAPPEKKNGF